MSMQIASNDSYLNDGYVKRDPQITTLWDHWRTYVADYPETGASIANTPILQRSIVALAKHFNPQPKDLSLLQGKLSILSQLQAGTPEALIALAHQNKAVVSM